MKTLCRKYLQVAVVGAVFIVMPCIVDAKGMQADIQCPQGGVVGQKCTDTTNGYKTQGHCVHINICKADKWANAPKGCSPGMVEGRDCPYGTSTPMYGGLPAKNSDIIQYNSGNLPQGIIDSDILNNAFESNVSSMLVNLPQTSHIEIIENIEYLITSANEILPVGEPLTQLPEIDYGLWTDSDVVSSDEGASMLSSTSLVPGTILGGYNFVSGDTPVLESGSGRDSARFANGVHDGGEFVNSNQHDGSSTFIGTILDLVRDVSSMIGNAIMFDSGALDTSVHAVTQDLADLINFMW